MSRYPRNYDDVDFDVLKKGRKRAKKVAGSTKATSDFLALIHAMHPEKTIRQIRDEITDKSKWILNPEAVSVCDAYIKNGDADVVPDWR